MTTSPCNLCGARETRLFRHPLQHEKVQLSIVECTGCSLLFADPFPTPTHLSQQYDAAYFNSVTPVEGGYENYSQDEPVTRKTFERRLDFLARRGVLAKQGNALDIGCATGVFLEALRDRNWNAAGIEISAFAANIARQKGFAVEETPIEKSVQPEDSLDLITMWDVIEHVADPAQTFNACWKRLKKDGYLVFTTPDASALLPKILGTYWVGFRCVGEHVYFFGRHTIARYLRHAGFYRVNMFAVGKYLSLNRFLTRLSYYTRILNIFKSLNNKKGFDGPVFYVSSGDTMLVIAHKAL